MPPVFASADIAALVAAFPTPWPTKDKPSLIRSNSGNNLVDSRRVLNRFRSLLETSPARIRLADLPSRLGISKIDWLLSCHENPIYYGRDGESLLTEPEVDHILNDLVARSRSNVINAASYAAGFDISSRTLRDLVAGSSGKTIHWWPDAGAPGEQYLYHDAFAQTVRERIDGITPAEWAEGLDSTQYFTKVPASLLVQLAEGASNEGSPPGKWMVLGDRAAFAPANYGAHLESRRQTARDAHIEQYLDELRLQGFCRIESTITTAHGAPDAVESDALVEDVKSRYDELPTNDDGSEELVEVLIGDGKSTTAHVLTQQGRLDAAMETLRLIAPQKAASVWHAREATTSPSTLQTNTLRSLEQELNTELHKLLLQSAHKVTIEEIVDHKIEQLQGEDHEHFREQLAEQLLEPVALYAAGIATIKDDTLRQHLEEYLGDHIRREVIQSFTTALREQRLLLDKSRRRDYEKFQQASFDAKTLSDIQTALSKFAKKQKVEQSNSAMLRDVKHQTLQAKAKAIGKMTRGSDILQNLIWILLACAADGLYMSSGKDTTRMIKQYQVIGDADVARQLEGWRDTLKVGKEDQGMLQEMREMAAKAVNGSGSSDPAE